MEREPSGRPQRVHTGPTPETLARRADILERVIKAHPERFARELATHPDAEWYIGRLYLVGAVSQEQRDAADRWRRLAREYEALLLAPKRPAALDMDRKEAAPPVFESEADAKKFRRLKYAYDRYFHALGECGHTVLRATVAALRDEEVRLDLLRAGLAALERA